MNYIKIPAELSSRQGDLLLVLDWVTFSQQVWSNLSFRRIFTCGGIDVEALEEYLRTLFCPIVKQLSEQVLTITVTDLHNATLL